jgi:hypothetical protein
MSVQSVTTIKCDFCNHEIAKDDKHVFVEVDSGHDQMVDGYLEFHAFCWLALVTGFQFVESLSQIPFSYTVEDERYGIKGLVLPGEDNE